MVYRSCDLDLSALQRDGAPATLQLNRFFGVIHGDDETVTRFDDNLLGIVLEAELVFAGCLYDAIVLVLFRWFVAAVPQEPDDIGVGEVAAIECHERLVLRLGHEPRASLIASHGAGHGRPV